MPHVFEFFSNKSDSTLRNKNGAKLYTSLPPFSHLLFYSPPPLLHFSYIFLDIPRKILWRVFHEFLLNSFRFRRRYTLNTSKSNWKYSIRAPCFYIFAFRNRFLSSSPFRCVWNSSCVCVRPPPEDLQKRPPSSSPPNIYFSPTDRFKASGSKNTCIYITFIGKNRAFAFPFVYVTRLQLSVNLQPQPRCFHRYFPVTISPSLPPSLLIIIL